ncbi:hypothetical protein [Micromonospora sp. CPCC 206061]|uniref:hypothetical protein n=1 Tax=Micromonospora sp. CPCC 206061 TaxID=3122410 RepID=UPI002FF1A952
MLTGAGLATAGLAVAGCGGSERPTIQESRGPSSGEPTTRALQTMLDRRAKAMQAGDEAGFLADLDQGNSKLIAQQKMFFANLRQFKLSAFRYLTESASPTPAEDEAYRFMPVHEVIQLNADAAPGGVSPAGSHRYSVAQRNGKLVIVEILPITRQNYKELKASYFLSADAPWLLTPLKVVYADNVCLAADASVPDLDRYVGVAGPEARSVEAFWGDRPRFPGHVLFLTRDAENYKNWFSLGVTGNFKPEVEGVQMQQRGVRNGGQIYQDQYAGARIVCNLANSEKVGNDPRRVMRHELIHAVTSRAMETDSFVAGAARWAVEGFAAHMDGSGYRVGLSQGLAAGKFQGRLPRTDDFYGEDRAFNYSLSAAAFRFAERAKGRAAAVEFYAKVIGYGNLEGGGDTRLPAFDGICRRVLGMSATTFYQQWSAFVRSGA